MNSNQNDQEIVDKRKNSLTEDENGDSVELPLRERTLAKLAAKLEELDIPKKVVEEWRIGNAERQQYLDRVREYGTQVDELIDPLYEPALEWSSTIHLPVILTAAKALHARFNAAVLSQDPPFAVIPRTSGSVDRAPLIEALLRYTIKDWVNYNRGIDDVVDKWIWDWVVLGRSVLKNRWDRTYTRFVDVEEVEVESVAIVVDQQTGEPTAVPSTELEEREVVKTIKRFDGPIVEKLELEDFMTIGSSDPQEADKIFHRSFMTADQLWQLADQGAFNKDAVKTAIESGADTMYTDTTTQNKQLQRQRSGMTDVQSKVQTDRYEILEVYLKVDVDGSGIGSDVIVWVHKDSRALLRATYLYRTSKTGVKPFHVAEFHRRTGDQEPIGLAELLYSLNKEVDALNNMNVDIGILTSMPLGFYRPSSAMEQEAIPIEPGALIPVDNPSQDIVFPNLGNRTAFGFNEISFLTNYVERLTSTSDLTFGAMTGAQGPTRSATGVRALMGESNSNLDVYLRRLNRPWQSMLKYVLTQLQGRVDSGFEFRVTGGDGKGYWEQIKSREELQGDYDFELDSNSANSNHQIQLDVANQIYQLTQNPLDLQLGLITPSERYEAIRNLLQVMKVKAISRFVRKPSEVARKKLPLEVFDEVLKGTDEPLDPSQDLDGIIALLQDVINNDDMLGQVDENAAMRIAGKLQEATQLKAQVEAAAAQAANVQQQQTNMTQAPGGISSQINLNQLTEAE
jgi:hypothetical protein